MHSAWASQKEIPEVEVVSNSDCPELVFRNKGSCTIRTHVFFSYSIDFL